MKLLPSLVVVALFVPAGVSFAAETADWTLDPGHSSVGFTAKHVGFAKVRGSFGEFAATAKGDAQTGKLTQLEATAQTKSVDTGIDKRDEHLRSDDFFNAEKFPVLKLKTKSIKWNGNAFTAEADLTLRDVTRPVTFKGEQLGIQKINFGSGDQLRTAYEATTVINRKDFGLKFNGIAEGTAVVSDDVTLQLEASFTRPLTATAAATPAAAPAQKKK